MRPGEATRKGNSRGVLRSPESATISSHSLDPPQLCTAVCPHPSHLNVEVHSLPWVPRVTQSGRETSQPLVHFPKARNGRRWCRAGARKTTQVSQVYGRNPVPWSALVGGGSQEPELGVEPRSSDVQHGATNTSLNRRRNEVLGFSLVSLS